MAITRKKVRLLSSIVLIIIAVIGLNTLDNREEQQSKNTQAASSDIDFFIVNATFKSFGKDGLLNQTAISRKVEHFKQLEKSELTLPTISNHTQLKLTTNISSDEAVIQDKKGQITFSDNVLVTNFKSNTQRTFLKSDLLHYIRDENSISTHTNIEFTDTFGNIITATGLFADINLKQMKLNSNVKGLFNER